MILLKAPKRRKSFRSNRTKYNPKIYLRTPRIKARREVPYRSIFIFTFVVIFTGFIIYGIFFSEYFAIKNIIVINNKSVTQKQVEEVISPSRYNNFGFNNILFFRSNKASELLLNNLRQLRSVEITKKLPNTIKIKVDERLPSLIWQTEDKKYLVDDEGEVFGEYNPDKVQDLPIIIDLTKKNVQVKQKILGVSFVDFVQKLTNKLPQKTGANIDSIVIKETPFEIEVKTKEGFSIFFDTSHDLDIQMAYLVKVLEEVNKNGMSNKYLDYIDLRLPDKIFYKYK